MQEEITWIRQIQRGDTDKFRLLYAKHQQRLWSLCWRFTCNVQDAEEQLQEIFMRVLRKLPKFQEKSSFSTWLYRLAVNHLINFKNRKKEGETILPEEHDRERFADPDLSLALMHAINELPPGYRQVFILHDQEGYGHDEIAKILNISAGTSRSQLYRARVALRERMKPTLQEGRVFHVAKTP